MALMSLENRVVTWPDATERREIARRVRLASGFPSCTGLVDGKMFVFEKEPELDGSDYFSRKGRYGMAGLVVCGDQKRVRYLYTGWAGCSHDARLMANSDMTLQREQKFTGAQYLLADSGFTPEPTVVPCLNKPPHSQLTDAQRQFNRALSRIRVRTEHCIGFLKGRFQGLKGLRLFLRSEDDDDEGDDADDWAPIEDELPDLIGHNDESNAYANTRGNTDGKRKRLQVMDVVLGALDESESEFEHHIRFQEKVHEIIVIQLLWFYQNQWHRESFPGHGQESSGTEVDKEEATESTNLKEVAIESANLRSMSVVS